jgi:hypothetical protein
MKPESSIQRRLFAITLTILTTILVIQLTSFNNPNYLIDERDWRTIVSIIVGVSALIISVWQGYETREKNRLSVTPMISIYGEYVLGSKYPGISLKNKGIGPAIIVEIEISTNKEYKLYSGSRALRDFAKDFIKICKINNISDIYFEDIENGDYIASDETLPLLWLKEVDSDKQETIDKLLELLNGFCIAIRYKSIYEVEFISTFIEEG